MAPTNKPHVLCIPSPFQSHIKAMLKLAKLLHHRGFHITFVNTEYNHKRFIRARGPDSLDGLPDFQFQTIPDGLPPSDADVSQDILALCQSIRNDVLLAPFLSLVENLNSSSATNSLSIPPVTSIVSDGFMMFTVTAAEQLGIPLTLFWTISACGFMGFYQFLALLERGFTPLKDASYLTNGYLDTIIDWIPGMNGICLKDLPSYIQTTDPNDIVFDFCMEATQRASKASVNIIQTFDVLEQDLLHILSSILPSVYAIGPLQLLLNKLLEENRTETIGYNLWKEESECLQWLDTKQPESVVYVNFGSIVVMTKQQLLEFAWGLANSNHCFLWIIRSDLVVGDSAILQNEFMVETKERSLIANWCPQEKVLNHPLVGGFLTHCGWNSTIESLSAGVPMICWPLACDQQTNCKYVCNEWGVGMEIDNDVKRDGIKELTRELMGGQKGRQMKNKAMDWKRLAEKATSPHGSSTLNLNNLVNKMLASV